MRNPIDGDHISRTVRMIWIVFALAVALVIAHIAQGGPPLAPQVLWLLTLLCVCLLLDKMGMKLFTLKFGKVIQVEAQSQTAKSGPHKVHPPARPGRPGTMEDGKELEN